jgi:hypothetical protein
MLSEKTKNAIDACVDYFRNCSSGETVIFIMNLNEYKTETEDNNEFVQLKEQINSNIMETSDQIIKYLGEFRDEYIAHIETIEFKKHEDESATLDDDDAEFNLHWYKDHTEVPDLIIDLVISENKYFDVRTIVKRWIPILEL